MDFVGGAVPILPDPGATNPLFTPGPGRSHYEDANLDGTADQKHPVLYAAGSIPEVNATFVLPATATGTYLVRGRGSDDLYFEGSASVSNGKLEVNGMQAKTAFGTVGGKSLGAQVKKYDAFTIDWELSSNGGASWTPAGQSSNTLYVSAAAPMATLRTAQEGIFATGIPAVGVLFETVVDVAISYNQGRTASDRAALINGTWAYFDNNNATRIDGTSLKYWGLGHATEAYYSTPFLLKNGDGRCDSWAHFLLDALAVNGVVADISQGEGLTGVQSQVTPLLDQQGFQIAGESLLIKDFAFAGLGRSGDRTYPYFWNATLRDIMTRQEVPVITDILAIPGNVPAQNNTRPLQTFLNHAIVTIGGQIFDPSYGTRFSTIDQWEDASVAGFYVPYVGKTARIDELLSGNDLNGNGTFNDLFDARGALARPNKIGVPEVTSRTEQMAYVAAGPTALVMSVTVAIDVEVSVASMKHIDASYSMGAFLSVESFGAGVRRESGVAARTDAALIGATRLAPEVFVTHKSLANDLAVIEIFGGKLESNASLASENDSLRLSAVLADGWDNADLDLHLMGVFAEL